MSLYQAFRFALDPTVAQRRALASHCGAARFTYNWGLGEVKRVMEARTAERELLGESLTPAMSWTLAALRRDWNQRKDEIAPWWRANSKEAYSSGIDGLARALRAWSKSRAGERGGEAVGFPQLRKRGHRDSCRFTTGAMGVVDCRHIVLPRIGHIRTCEKTAKLLREKEKGRARVVGATISREADRWFVSFTCEVKRCLPAGNGHQDTIGVDLGVHTLAALSTGEVVRGARPLRRAQRRLRRLQRTVSRRQKGSQRRRKAIRRLARAHRRVANVRRHHLHVLTTRLAKNHGRIVIEDLNLRGMSRSARGTADVPGRNVRAKAGQNRAVLDGAFGELRRMLAYKCTWYGATLAVADRWFASSKRCSSCAATCAGLRRSERTYRCAQCGLALDRDVNAARDLVWWATCGGTPPAAPPATTSEEEAEGGRHGLSRVAASAAETENARGGAAVIRPEAGEGPREARTGNVPEPTEPDSVVLMLLQDSLLLAD